MTELKAQRLNAVVKAINNYSIDYGGASLITMHDLAWNLNNTWNAHLFISRDKVKIKQYFSLDGVEIYKMYRAIRHAIRNTDIELVVPPKNKPDYLIFKE